MLSKLKLASKPLDASLALLVLIVEAAIAFSASVGGWAVVPESGSIYLSYFPISIGLPFAMMSTPLVFGASIGTSRVYSWATALLAIVMAGFWVTFALSDPQATSSLTRHSLVGIGLFGGLAWQGLFLFLLSGGAAR